MASRHSTNAMTRENLWCGRCEVMRVIAHVSPSGFPKTIVRLDCGHRLSIPTRQEDGIINLRTEPRYRDPAWRYC